MDDLVKELKGYESFRADEYLDSKGNPTVGYGTKLPLTASEEKTFNVVTSEDKKKHIKKEDAEALLKHRLNQKIVEIQKKKPFGQ
jgi:GH24 family phage-related lysozyme (muramidase)